MKNEQHLLTVKTITAFLFPFSSRMIYLFIFLHSGSLFIQSSPAVGCWGMMHFCFFFFFSSFFSGDILRVYSKSPWQLDGNIASPSPPPPLCYFLLFLEAVLNMYEGWDWQVGFNWFWSALHEQQPALCPFCGGCVLLFFFLFFSSPFSVFSISFISPLICSDNADNTFFLTPQHPRVSASSDFSSVQVQHPQATLESHPNWMSDMC